MKHFVQEHVTEGGYSSASEYMRELIRAEQKRKVEERIDILLLEGLDSGQPIPVPPEFWEEKKVSTDRAAKQSHSAAMTRLYHILPVADRDLDDQAAFLAAEASLETALRFYDAASSTFGKIASMPSIGEQWLSTNPRLTGLRVWRIEGFPNHLIFYRAIDGSRTSRQWMPR